MDIKNIPNSANPYINDLKPIDKNPGLDKSLPPVGKAEKNRSFEESLSEVLSGKAGSKAQIDGQSVVEGLKFSNHAIERMRDRGIAMKPEEMTRLNEAVERAAKKGSKESLVLMGDLAMIVSVKNKTVVTAMDRASMKDKVFSNIDSTVVI